MEKIEIKSLDDLKKVSEYLKNNDYVEVSLDDGMSFVALSNSQYYAYKMITDSIAESEEIDNNEENLNSQIKIITKDGVMNDNLTVEQYEFIKKEINHVIEKTLKPKPEKLN